jgi:hypothetical protein
MSKSWMTFFILIGVFFYVYKSLPYSNAVEWLIIPLVILYFVFRKKEKNIENLKALHGEKNFKKIDESLKSADVKEASRLGVIGGLAQTIGPQYLEISIMRASEVMDNNPELFKKDKSFNIENMKIFNQLIKNRVSISNVPGEEQILIEQINKTTGLLGLCICFLKVEAELYLNSDANIIIMLEVIVEELIKVGLGERAIYGAGIENNIKNFLKFAKESPFST